MRVEKSPIEIFRKRVEGWTTADSCLSVRAILFEGKPEDQGAQQEHSSGVRFLGEGQLEGCGRLLGHR